MMTVHPEALYQGPRIPFVFEQDNTRYSFRGFIEPWSERDVDEAVADSVTGIKRPLIILDYGGGVRQGTYLSPDSTIRVASSKALSSSNVSPYEPNWFILAVSAAFCRLMEFPASMWNREWYMAEYRGCDVEGLTNQINLVVVNRQTEEWWNFASLQQLKIADYK